jgi:predicted HTH transcriptional regulator
VESLQSEAPVGSPRLLPSCVVHDELEFIHPFAAYLLAAIENTLQKATRRQGISTDAGSQKRSVIGSEMGERLGISQRAIEKHLAALQRQGHLRRQGSPPSGTWQVLPLGSGA